MKYEYAVFIGRFQPVTLAHRAIIERALDIAENVIIFVGSYKAPISLRNPFTHLERATMILSSIKGGYWGRVTTIPILDSNYAFNSWLREIKYKVDLYTENSDSICLMSHTKDKTSYYLDHFPEWDNIYVETLFDNLSATDIRNKLFEGDTSNIQVPEGVVKFIDYILLNNEERFKTLSQEYEFIKQYKKSWEVAPYPVTFVTTDSIVLCKGHILLIKRGRLPGKDKYALPGGFLDIAETIENGCIRELLEETNIAVPEQILRKSVEKVKTIDNPIRDPRGRCITFAHLIRLELDYLPEIEAGDDACKAEWIPIYDLGGLRESFFNDHLQIIYNFLDIGVN